MKKITAISCLLILFISQIGYHFIYILQQHQLKEEAEAQLLAIIPESSLEMIDADVNKNDIQWEEAGKEFYLHGQLYDIAKVKKVNGRNILYCFNDKKEEQLLKDLSKAVRSGSDQNTGNKNGKHIIKFQLFDLALLTEKNNVMKPLAPMNHTDFNATAVSCIKEINAPPPRNNI